MMDLVELEGLLRTALKKEGSPGEDDASLWMRHGARNLALEIATAMGMEVV